MLPVPALNDILEFVQKSAQNGQAMVVISMDTDSVVSCCSHGNQAQLIFMQQVFGYILQEVQMNRARPAPAPQPPPRTGPTLVKGEEDGPTPVR